MKTIFILGAGASRQAGGPLMSDFLDVAEALLRKKTDGVFEVKDDFDNVFNALAELQAVHAKSFLDLDNIEILFGAIEMAQLIGKLGERDREEIIKLRESIITLIFKTLEYSIIFPVQDQHIYPPEPYRAFLNTLSYAQSKTTPIAPHEFAFMTFNYDLTLDYSLHHAGYGFDYCLDESSEKDAQIKKVPYLKLHGSINWGTCEECGKIIPRHTSEARFNLFPGKGQHVVYNLGSTLHAKNHCGKPLKGPPILVPPTWNKTGYHEQLANVWGKASAELSTAENIFVIGYSLPETDSFFRYLYALGSESPIRIKRFWVFNPDIEGGVEQRFRDLIGRGIENRFKYFHVTFEDAIPIIGNALKEI
jgi:hypothetical protein